MGAELFLKAAACSGKRSVLIQIVEKRHSEKMLVGSGSGWLMTCHDWLIDVFVCR